MSSQVKIKARPDQQLTFPALCVHCAHPAVARMTVRKRLGRMTRLIDMPLCATCVTELGRQSGAEERLQKISRLLLGLAFGLILAFSLWQLPAELGWGLRLLVAFGLTGTAVSALYLWLVRLRQQAALPEKQAIRQSAQIITFSWRAITFQFTNETFSQRFKQLNQSLIMNS